MVNNMTDLTAQEPAWQTRDHLDDPVIGELRNRFGPDAFTVQATRTGVPVVWIKREQLLEVGDFLKKLPKPYVMLFDLHGMDERLRTHREGLPAADFSVFYHLISIDRNRDIMLKVALAENDLHVPTFTKLFPNANWYERETWDLFGITFDGHPNLRRIMMPQTWKGHPLRKDYPARATEFSPFELTKAKQDLEMEALTFKPEEWGMKRGTENEDFMFLNLGPNHPSAHGAFRIVLQLDGEEIVDTLNNLQVVAIVDDRVRCRAKMEKAFGISYVVFRIGSFWPGEKASLQCYAPSLYRRMVLKEIVLDGNTQGTLSNLVKLQGTTW